MMQIIALIIAAFMTLGATAPKDTCLTPADVWVVCDQKYTSSQGVITYRCMDRYGKQVQFIDGGQA